MILTNAEVGRTMSNLEVRARQGCPFAQEELQKKAMAAAKHLRHVRRTNSLSMEQAIKETKLG